MWQRVWCGGKYGGGGEYDGGKYGGGGESSGGGEYDGGEYDGGEYGLLSSECSLPPCRPTQQFFIDQIIN